MNNKWFNRGGWFILLGMAVTWIFYGFSNIFIFLILAARICFSIYDGSIKKWKIGKRLSLLQIFRVIGVFIVAVAIAFGIIMLAFYLIRDIFHLSGIVKTIAQFIAVMIALFPASYLLQLNLKKVIKNVKAQEEH